MSERPTNRPSSRPVAIDIPNPSADRPSWAKVGIVAVVGFVVGVAWPKALGVRLGPSAPGASNPTTEPASEEKKVDPKETAKPTTAVVPTTTSAATPGAATASTAIPATAAPEVTVTVRKGNILNCKKSDGGAAKGKECGALALDEALLPRIKGLAQCKEASGQTGKLSLVFNIDFDKNRTTVAPGKSSTVQNLDGFSDCLRGTVEGLRLKNIKHEHPIYSVAYSALIGAGTNKADAAHEDRGAIERPIVEKADTKTPAPAEKPAPSASGNVEVSWDAAIVRDAPKTGTIVGKLAKGTQVRVGAQRDGWYNVHYGDGLSQEGWIYRAAIGR